jgi:hypothetical protein
MMDILLYGVVLFPIVAGVLLLLVGRELRPVRRYAGLAVTLIASVCGVGLLFVGEHDLLLPVAWLPGAGAWSLQIGGIGLVALAVTVGSALVARIAILATSTDCTPELDAIFLIALGSAAFAFLAGHFLARYLALEIVALCVAAACIVQLRSDAGAQAAGYVYLVLRIGDAGLLAAILLLLGAAKTLDVGPALQSGMGLGAMPLAWVVGGFSLAAWVKVGAWPFHGWHRLGVTQLPGVGAWLYGILVPQLGLYLLYRVTPLIAFGGGVAPMTVLVLGLASIAASVTLWERSSRSVASLQVYGSALLGSLGIAFAATGFTTGVSLLLIGGAVLRVGMYVWRMVPVAVSVNVASTANAGSSVDAPVPTPLETVEQDALGRGLIGAVRGIMSGAQLLHNTVEQGLFERGPVKMGQAVMDGARTLHSSVEQGGLEDLLPGTARAVVSVSHTIQRMHTGRLRTGMLWVVLSLLAVVLLARAQ